MWCKDFLFYCSRLEKKVIGKFLKTVEEEDLFPGEVWLFKNVEGLRSNPIEELQCNALKNRNKNSDFVRRVLKRFDNTNKNKRIILKMLIEIIKEYGLETDNEQLLMSEKILKKLAKLSESKFEIAFKFGINMYCLEKKIIKGKVNIILLSDDIDKEDELDHFTDEKRIGCKIFKLIQEHGVENEKGELISALEKVEHEINVGIEEFEKALEY